MAVLKKEFYLRSDVTDIARELLGKELFTKFDGKITSGIITETEAYAGVTDRASHAYGGRKTARTEVMFREGGIAYIYLCYGVHSLFNVVTNSKDIPHAVLIRAIKPVEGISVMEERRGKRHEEQGFSDGPGKLALALGIHFSCSGMSLLNAPDGRMAEGIWIGNTGFTVLPGFIECTPRIGVDYAGEDAKLPYRFLIRT